MSTYRDASCCHTRTGNAGALQAIEPQPMMTGADGSFSDGVFEKTYADTELASAAFRPRRDHTTSSAMQTFKKPLSASRLIWQSRNKNQRRSPRWPAGIENIRTKKRTMGSSGQVSRGRTVSNPLKRLVEPMGVEPTASRVRF
jgi:hypothetical protein